MFFTILCMHAKWNNPIFFFFGRKKADRKFKLSFLYFRAFPNCIISDVLRLLLILKMSVSPPHRYFSIGKYFFIGTIFFSLERYFSSEKIFFQWKDIFSIGKIFFSLERYSFHWQDCQTFKGANAQYNLLQIIFCNSEVFIFP